VLDGQIDVDDRAAKPQARRHRAADRHSVRSSLPRHIKINVLPELSASVNGALVRH
jgi:hypothetical protein